jgi:hypothetical protein
VATGDRVAQFYNRDPFAFPVWRSPVYRTPSAFAAAVQAARLIGRLIRFSARHPVTVLAVITGVVLWRTIGSAGHVALAVSVAVSLAVWRWQFPASFSRFVAAPARGRWRPGTIGAAGLL